MSEEEKELVEKFQNLYIKEFNNEPITSDDRLSYIECALITNLIEELDKELNTLKEIEQLHQEENGKLRVELKQEKEKNKQAEKRGYKRGLDTANKIWIHRIEYLKLFREFQLQQQCKEYEDDIEWQTYNNLLEEK